MRTYCHGGSEVGREIREKLERIFDWILMVQWGGGRNHQVIYCGEWVLKVFERY